jgi:hypothetical protein
VPIIDAVKVEIAELEKMRTCTTSDLKIETEGC